MKYPARFCQLCPEIIQASDHDALAAHVLEAHGGAVDREHLAAMREVDALTPSVASLVPKGLVGGPKVIYGHDGSFPSHEEFYRRRERYSSSYGHVTPGPALMPAHVSNLKLMTFLIIFFAAMFTVTSAFFFAVRTRELEAEKLAAVPRADYHVDYRIEKELLEARWKSRDTDEEIRDLERKIEAIMMATLRRRARP